MKSPDRLTVFFGLIATGKSTLAHAWALRREAVYLNTDRVRKELAGIPPDRRLTDGYSMGIYTPDFTGLTYKTMLERAEIELTRGGSIVLDGSYQTRQNRDAVRDMARRNNVRPFFVFCTCPEAEIKRRMEERARNRHAISDGRWEIYIRQKERFEAPDELSSKELITISTDYFVEDLLNQLESQLLS